KLQKEQQKFEKKNLKEQEKKLKEQQRLEKQMAKEKEKQQKEQEKQSNKKKSTSNDPNAPNAHEVAATTPSQQQNNNNNNNNADNANSTTNTGIVVHLIPTAEIMKTTNEIAERVMLLLADRYPKPLKKEWDNSLHKNKDKVYIADEVHKILDGFLGST